MKIPADFRKKYLLLPALLLCAFCSSFTFFMNYTGVKELSLNTNNRLYYHLYCVLEELLNACHGCELLLSFGLIGLFLFYRWIHMHPEYQVKIRFQTVISLLFSFVHVTGTIILNEIGWKTSGQLVKMSIAFVGGCFFYRAVIQVLFVFLQKEHPVSLPFLPRRIKAAFWKAPGRFTFLFLLCCWTIPILLKYPAGICVDVTRQLDQGLGNIPLTAHHPVFHTMLMTWFVKLGNAISSSGFGIFLFCLVETLILAAIFGFILSTLVRFSTRKWVLAVSLLFFAFSPYITGYVGTPIKDLYFVAMVCLYVLALFVYSIDPKIFWGELRFPVLFVLSCAGMVLFRNNGVYICLLTGIVLLLHELWKYRKKAFSHAIIILLSMILAFSSTKIVNGIYDPVPGSIREALSIPFQQTARYAAQHGDEVTEKEKAAINKLLPYDKLAELYNPYISDPVKNRYNDDATREDLKEYLKVWFQQLKKHPGCYVKAVYQQNVFLLYPQYNNYKYYLDTSPLEYIDNSVEGIKTPELLERIQVLYMQALELSHKLPVLNLINNMAVYIMLLLVFVIFTLHKKNYSHLFYYLPLLISLLIIIAAPCIRGHVRYAYPIIYTFPIWLAGYTYTIGQLPFLL